MVDALLNDDELQGGSGLERPKKARRVLYTWLSLQCQMAQSWVVGARKKMRYGACLSQRSYLGVDARDAPQMRENP